MQIPFIDVARTLAVDNHTKYGDFDIFIEKYYPMNYSLFGSTSYIVRFNVVHNYNVLIRSHHIFAECDNPSAYDVMSHIEYVYKKWRYTEVAVIPNGIIHELVKHELSYIFEDDEVADVIRCDYRWVFMYAQLMAQEIQFLNHFRDKLHDIIFDAHQMCCYPPHDKDYRLKLPFKENWKC